MNDLDAIATLEQAGIDAQLREGAWGNAIYAGVNQFNEGGISGHRFALYIRPGDGIWHVTDGASIDEAFSSLDEAVTHAIPMFVAVMQQDS